MVWAGKDTTMMRPKTIWVGPSATLKINIQKGSIISNVAFGKDS